MRLRKRSAPACTRTCKPKCCPAVIAAEHGREGVSAREYGYRALPMIRPPDVGRVGVLTPCSSVESPQCFGGVDASP
eukprot:7788439-Lingulodinium_polyedra.AAC.1